MKDEKLIKYLEGTLSPKTIEEVEEWILLSEENTKRFNIIKAEYILSSLKKVKTSVNIDEKYKSFKQNNIDKKGQFKELYKYAAAIVILITTAVILFTYEDKEVLIPDGAITLELEDGTLKILNPENSFSIKDKSGEIISQQKGNQLIYSNANSTSQLVYNTLSVPNGKTFELILSDGTKAHLNAGSTIKYPMRFLSAKPREIFITGETFLDISKDINRPFIVNTDDLNVRVLGTKFNVHAYPEDSVTEIVLVEGSVDLYNDTKPFDEKNTVLLEPGHKASYGRNSKEIDIQAVDTAIYTSWRSGELVFRNMTFNNIIKKLERFYNLSIVNNNSTLSNTVFNASFGVVPVEKVMQELKEVYGIDYEIIDGTIIIKEQQKNQ
ncbi:hypothetical protein BFP77_14050 [Maribacter sp. 4U21]|uniref:FecR family protein n=1 Tax=Maribacter sp. 4U21 TaxID=1889779 RepID=UPI000C155277|nr:FecR domain-containing protein [Maribacter sp. 4U21]PIB27148.1 hypothetical protein BFP77_14050 [Maribacter sp. 4U21]